MADSKAYLSFVLLFSFLLSSHVLTHELPQGHWSPPRQHETKKNHYTHSVGYHNSIGLQSTFSLADELASKDTPFLIPTKAKAEREEVELYCVYTKSPGGTRAEVDQYTPMAGSKPRDIQWPPGHWASPRQHKAKKDHYTRSISYHNSIGLQSTFSSPDELASKETRNHEDETVMRDRKMIRPSETDWKSFHAFSSKSSRMTDGYKTGYNGASNMEEEVGEETVN